MATEVRVDVDGTWGLTDAEAVLWSEVQQMLEEPGMTALHSNAGHVECDADTWADKLGEQEDLLPIPLPPSAIECIPVASAVLPHSRHAPTGKRKRRAACEAVFDQQIYPDQDTMCALARLDNMSVTQVNDWFTNKRRRTGLSVYEKPRITSDYNMILDWLIENPSVSPPRELKAEWAKMLSKTLAQITQWIANIKKQNRKISLLTRGIVSINAREVTR